jgi:hypothetical protein
LPSIRAPSPRLRVVREIDIDAVLQLLHLTNDRCLL